MLEEDPLYPRKKSESPEIRFLWHFQKAKKVAIKTVMAIKTVAIKTVMDCNRIFFEPWRRFLTNSDMKNSSQATPGFSKIQAWLSRNEGEGFPGFFGILAKVQDYGAGFRN